MSRCHIYAPEVKVPGTCTVLRRARTFRTSATHVCMYVLYVQCTYVPEVEMSAIYDKKDTPGTVSYIDSDYTTVVPKLHVHGIVKAMSYLEY